MGIMVMKGETEMCAGDELIGCGKDMRGIGSELCCCGKELIGCGLVLNSKGVAML